jgi:hypothetical protein
MEGTLTVDVVRARQVAARLLAAYQSTGIFGTKEMPEDMLPEGVEAGSEEHLRFITLTVAIDYQRNADDLWAAARATYADPATRYLFDPPAVAHTGPMTVVEDMHRRRLSKKAEQDARIWQTVCTTLTRHFGGTVHGLLESADYSAPAVLRTVQTPPYANGFPFLKGPKIGPLWERMLHDNCGVRLRRLAEVPLPVDVHTAQASLQTGVVRTEGYRGPMGPLREAVQQAWLEALQDPGAGLYPLRMDEPLWLLSRQGCRRTGQWPCEFLGRCPVAEHCESRHVWLGLAGSETTDHSEVVVAVRG